MRIQRKIFPLGLILAGSEPKVVAMDRHFNALDFAVEPGPRDTWCITISAPMPDKIHILLEHTADCEAVRLTAMHLAGLMFNRSRLIDLIEYRLVGSQKPLDQMAFETSPVSRNLDWLPGSFASVDLFDSDPWTYHLHQGTKIVYRDDSLPNRSIINME